MKLILNITLLVALMIPIALEAESFRVVEDNEINLKLSYSSANVNVLLSGSKPLIHTSDPRELILTDNYDLPVQSTLIQVPELHSPVLTVKNPVYEKIENISLQKVSNGIVTAQSHVAVSEPFVMRGNLLVSLSVQPYLYNAEESSLSVLKSAELDISFAPNPTYRINTPVRQTAEFKSWLSDSVINYRDNSRLGEATGSLVIIYNPAASDLSIIQPLIDWKHQKGWDVRAVSTTETGASTTGIKNYLQNAYNTWTNPPEYVLLLGRATTTNIVPTYSEFYYYNTVGDYKYVLLDGSDIIPDAYIGRLTFASADQLTTMINKIIAYEKNQGLSGSNWFNSGLLVSDETDSGPSCTTCIDYVKTLMLEYNPDTQLSYINTGTFAPQIITALNQGVSNYYYRGHNGYSGVTNTDISNLINAGRYPFISLITCFSGNFGQQSTLSIGEQFMRVGTTSSPKGAIGFIGSSCETHTCLNNIMTGAIAYGLYREGLTNQGQVLHRAKLGLMACYPQNPYSYLNQNFQSLNLLGDPTLDIWLRQPRTLNVSHSQSAGLVNGFLSVTVTDANGNPVDRARVCLLKGNDEIFQSGYTNANGTYVFDWIGVSAGNGILTVSKQNFTPYQSNIEFISLNNSISFNSLASFEQLYSGAQYTFPLSLTNNQFDILTDVSATLTSSSSLVNIAAGNVTFGNFALGQTKSSFQNVEFSLSRLCGKGEILDFSLQVQGYHDTTLVTVGFAFQVSEYGAHLELSNVQLGSDNMILPGETSNLTFKLKNIGTVTATGISANIHSYNPNITISQSTQPFSNLFAGYSTTNAVPFVITASPNLYSGTPVIIIADISYNNVAVQQFQFTIVVGDQSPSGMTGPDTYGYICVANNDSHPLARPYNWVEIVPSLGGNGSLLSLVDNQVEGSGSFATVNLPFNFRFYGQDYSTLTICSNGFLMPGSQGSQEWMNWSVPGPMVPRPIIAPFWDDLLIYSDSRIAYYHDTENNSFIVEWSALRNKFSISYQETFQVIIYGTDVLPTPTGDNAFLFQYKTFNNVDSGNYGVAYVDHGQYATVGIADHTGLVGLQYTYQNIYPPTTSALSNNSCLLFTTMQNQNFTPNPVIQSVLYLEETPLFPNNQIDCGETISLLPTIMNTGSAVLNASSAALVCNSDYVTILSGNSSLEAISPNQSIALNQPFRIRLDQDCPNLTEIRLNIQVSTGSVQYTLTTIVTVHAPEVQVSNIITNGLPVDYLDAGVSLPLTLNITNLSNLNLNNVNFVFDNNPAWTVTPAIHVFNLPASGTATLSFSFSSSPAAHWGEEITLSGLFFYPEVYDSVFSQTLLLGQLETICSQDFNSLTATHGWLFSSNVSVQPAALISGTGLEVVINPVPEFDTYSVTSPPIPAFDSQFFSLNFRYMNQNNETQNEILISYNDSETWYSVLDFSGTTSQPVNAGGFIKNPPADLRTVRFKWQINYLNDTRNLIALDDVILKAVHHPKGFISGSVALDFDPQLLSQVRLTLSDYPDLIMHPDSDGAYNLPVYQGSYNQLRAELDNYMPALISGFQVLSGQTTSLPDLSLAYLRRPVNLSCSLEENTLYLSWELQTLSDSLQNRLVPIYYKIYLTGNQFMFVDSTAALDYSLNIEYGTYLVFIKSVYLDQNNQTLYSQSSDSLTINYTSNPDSEPLPQVLSLSQNFPNPFNPNTQISFTLPQARKTSLIIYNIRGEAVRKLLETDLKAGTHKVQFDGLDDQRKPLASGVYFYRLTCSDRILTRKMMLLK
jgi:hypothetical protein